MATLPTPLGTDSQATGEGSRRIVNWIQLLAQQAATTALDLVFPPMCVNCERVGSFLCDRCLATICPGPVRTLAALDGIVVCAEYAGAVRAAIHAFKYENQRRLVEVLGSLLADAVAPKGWSVDVVTAVPMHETRLRERGYNQAALLASRLAQARGERFVPQAVARIRATVSQVNLNAQERQVNVADAFLASPQQVAGCRVLVVDDVLTTGATLSACANALRAAGAIQVWGAAVASAVDHTMM